MSWKRRRWVEAWIQLLFFCRALTNVDDNFLPVLSSEELKSESKWCSAFELLDHFFASTWTGSVTEGTKSSSPCSTSWQWTWNKLTAALAKKMKSECETGKTIFSSFRLPTHWAKRWEEGRYTKQMLFAPSHWDVLRLFILLLMRMKFMQFEPQGRKEGPEDKLYSEDQNCQWKGMKV